MQAACSSGSHLTPSLRRSARKRRNSLDQMFCTPPSSLKKKRNYKKINDGLIKPPEVEKQVPSLDQLPSSLLYRLLGYLQVEHLESLAATCSLFDRMIHGRYLTTLEFPFHSYFIKELASTDLIEKKPLLRLLCCKSRDWVCPTAQVIEGEGEEEDEDQDMHWFMMETTDQLSTYLMRSQLSLLSMSHLRELDLVPDSLEDIWSHPGPVLDEYNLDQYLMFDEMLVKELLAQGHLTRLTRFGVFQGQRMYLKKYVGRMTSLIEMKLVIITRRNLRKKAFEDYVAGVEAVVSRCQAKILKFNVVDETRRKKDKVLINSQVERLVVTGHCCLNLVLVMSNLREVRLKNLEAPRNVQVCSYWNARPDDLSSHREGLCYVNFASVYYSCPKLESFAGISVGDIPRSLCVLKWNEEVKKRFFKSYESGGGTLDLSTWKKRRWLKKQQLLKCRCVNFLTCEHV